MACCHPRAPAAALLAALACGCGCGSAWAQVSATAPALKLDVGRRTALLYAPRPEPPDVPLPVELGRPTPRASLGLEFASPPKADGARNLLRVQLSADSALAFRPRGGGLALTYRSTF